MPDKQEILEFVESNVVFAQFEMKKDDLGLEQASLINANATVPLRRTLVASALCSIMIIAGGNTPTTVNSVTSGVRSNAPTVANISGVNTTTIIDTRNRRTNSNEVYNFKFSGSDRSDFVSIGEFVAYIDNGSDDKGRAEQMLQKIIENRNNVEKQGIYVGIILSLILIIATLLTPSLTWNATIPGTILSLSLTGFMYLRRQSRR